MRENKWDMLSAGSYFLERFILSLSVYKGWLCLLCSVLQIKGDGVAEKMGQCEASLSRGFMGRRRRYRFQVPARCAGPAPARFWGWKPEASADTCANWLPYGCKMRALCSLTHRLTPWAFTLGLKGPPVLAR